MTLPPMKPLTDEERLLLAQFIAQAMIDLTKNITKTDPEQFIALSDLRHKLKGEGAG